MLRFPVVGRIATLSVRCAMQECGLLDSGNQTDAQKRHTNENNSACSATSRVATSGECRYNNDAHSSPTAMSRYADYTDCPRSQFNDIFYTGGQLLDSRLCMHTYYVQTPIFQFVAIFTSPPCMEAEYCDLHVCPCLRPRAYLRDYTPMASRRLS